jgi:hypothetical protein
MPANKKLLVLPGDGIGPEVMRETRRIIDWMERRRMVSFEISEGLVGGAAIDATGSPCPDETVEAAMAADAVLFGSVGGPKWDSLPFEKRPELGVLRLRKDLGLFANLRPAVVLDPLVEASSLKADIVRGVDTTIPFCSFVMKHEAFRSARFDTSFVKQYWTHRAPDASPDSTVYLAAALALHESRNETPSSTASTSAQPDSGWWHTRRTI